MLRYVINRVEFVEPWDVERKQMSRHFFFNILYGFKFYEKVK